MSRDFAFDVLQHVVDNYADGIGFIPDVEQHYILDRITGTRYVGATAETMTNERIVIIPRAVGFENADRFRRWVTVDKTHWGAMTARPQGWRVFVLMIGLLPDGQPWWSTLYDEQVLAEKRDFSEQMGGFYRFDPGLTGPARIAGWDKDDPSVGFRDSPATYAIAKGGSVTVAEDADAFVAELWDIAAAQEEFRGEITVTADQMLVKVG